MERKTFIENDPLVNKIVNFLRDNPKNSYSADEIADNMSGVFTTKQVQMVMSLLMREGMIKASNKDGRAAYQIKP